MAAVVCCPVRHIKRCLLIADIDVIEMRKDSHIVFVLIRVGLVDFFVIFIVQIFGRRCLHYDWFWL